MTRLGLLVLVVAAGFFAYINAVQLAFVLVYVAALLGLLSFLWGWWAISHLALERTVLGDSSPGEPVRERFVLRNLSGLPLTAVEVHDLASPSRAKSLRVVSLSSHGVLSWEATTAFELRGIHPLGPTELQLSDPFGLFPRRLLVPATSEALVYPSTFPIADPSPYVLGQTDGDRTAQRVEDIPPGAAGIREHDPADPISRVHWVSTARRGRLMSRAFEAEEAAPLLILLDLQAGTHVGTAPQSTLEYAVTAAATLARTALAGGRPVALSASDQALTRIAMGQGAIHERRIMRHLATVEADGRVPLAHFLERELADWGGRGGLTVVTADHGGEWAEKLAECSHPGERALAVFVDPATFLGAEPSRIPAQWRLVMDLRVIGCHDPLDLQLDPGGRHAVV